MHPHHMSIKACFRDSYSTKLELVTNGCAAWIFFRDELKKAWVCSIPHSPFVVNSYDRPRLVTLGTTRKKQSCLMKMPAIRYEHYVEVGNAQLLLLIVTIGHGPRTLHEPITSGI